MRTRRGNGGRRCRGGSLLGGSSRDWGSVLVRARGIRRVGRVAGGEVRVGEAGASDLLEVGLRLGDVWSGDEDFDVVGGLFRFFVCQIDRRGFVSNRSRPRRREGGRTDVLDNKLLGRLVSQHQLRKEVKMEVRLRLR
jgi:hypothetical protein